MNNEKEEESLNITNINLLVRFNNTPELFPSVTQVLSIFLTTAATSASVERVNSKERVTKIPAARLPHMRRCELSAAINQRLSVCEAHRSGTKTIRR